MIVAVGVFALAALNWRGPRAAPRADGPLIESVGDGAPVSYRDAASHFQRRAARAERQLVERPNDPELLYRIACCRWQRAYMLSLDAYTSDPDMSRILEIESNPDYVRWMNRSLARDTTGDLREAAQAARKGLAHERDPQRRWWLLRQLARIECARRKHDLELQALLEGRKLRPSDPEVLSRLARAQGEVGDYLGRENSLERLWSIARAKGQDAPVVSPVAMEGGRPGQVVDDGRWSSSGPDGDDWLSGLCIGTGARRGS